MVRFTREIGMAVARYPGGCGSHLFDWKKAEEYARRYREYWRAMKSVDSSIKLGAVLMNDVMPQLSEVDENGYKTDG